MRDNEKGIRRHHEGENGCLLHSGKDYGLAARRNKRTISTKKNNRCHSNCSFRTNNGLYPVPGHARFWKGTLAQHKGRLHRSYNGKQEVLIYDYVDFRIPMLERMYHKRLSGYSAIGYTVQGSKTSPAGDNRWYGGINYLGFEKVAQGAIQLSSMELSRELIQN